MRIQVLIIANIIEPLDTATQGMERSTYELIQILSTEPELELSVIAHKASSLPINVRFFGTEALPCPNDYATFGGGANKWEHIANDEAICRAFMKLKRRWIVHDVSSSLSAAILSANQCIPLVKTLRLMPSHPANSLTASDRDWTIHISDFQKREDSWSSKTRSSTIYDYVPFHPNPSARKQHSDSALSIGRVEPQKGHHVALEVARSLGLKLRIIGAHKNDSYWSRLSRESDVCISGPVPHGQISQELANASCLIWTPQIPEPGGRVVIEALRSGLRVFAHAIGVAADLIEAGSLMPTPAVSLLPPVYELTKMPDDWISKEKVIQNHLEVYRSISLFY